MSALKYGVGSQWLRGVQGAGLVLALFASPAAFAFARFSADATVGVQLTGGTGPGLAVAIFDSPLATSHDATDGASSSAEAHAAPTVAANDGALPVPMSVGDVLTLEIAAAAQAEPGSGASDTWGMATASAVGMIAIENTSGADQPVSFALDWVWSALLSYTGLGDSARVAVMLDLVIGNADPDADADDPANTLRHETLFSESFDRVAGPFGGNGLFSVDALMIPQGIWALVATLSIDGGSASPSTASAPLPSTPVLLLPALAWLARVRRRGEGIPLRTRLPPRLVPASGCLPGPWRVRPAGPVRGRGPGSRVPRPRPCARSWSRSAVGNFCDQLIQVNCVIRLILSLGAKGCEDSRGRETPHWCG